MKKNLYTIIILLMGVFFYSCEADEPKSATVMINVNYEGASAYPSIVKLYDYEEAKSFDNSYSGACHFGDYMELVDVNGKVFKPKFVSDIYGVNTFENVPNGKYLAIILYKPKGYSWAFSYYYGYKIIDVNGELSFNLIDFKAQDMLQRVQCFVEF